MILMKDTQFYPPRFLVSVLLTGGIVGVAGQFRGWQFAAYAVYPLCKINQRLSFKNTHSVKIFFFTINILIWVFLRFE